MVGKGLRALWAEPRPEGAPARVWRDWFLLAALLTWAALETLVREDLSWWPVSLFVSAVVALALMCRRSHPLSAVAVAFGVLTAVDIVRIAAGNEDALLSSISGALLLPYSLFRWGAGREAGKGLGFILVWLVVTHIADPTDAGEVVAGYGFFLFSGALGASIRFHANAHVRDIEEAKVQQRSQLARELHDAIGHHVSAIAIQAQAGRAVAASDPERAQMTLETIEQTASRALGEMRAMVGVLRDGAEADLAPQPSLADIQQLARRAEGGPVVEVRQSGDLTGLNPAVQVALYRIAQESVTNAVRHAQDATRVTIDVVDEGQQVRLTVRDDGNPATGSQTSTRYGLVGMTERTALLGGTLRAGPGPDGGWTVDAVFPTGKAPA
jgi:signal transduction histidine kinase